MRHCFKGTGCGRLSGEPQASFDGIWACASILHLPKDELAQVLALFHPCRTGGYAVK